MHGAGCERPNYSGGLCELHAKRAQRHEGDPLGGRWSEAIPPGAEGETPVEIGAFSRPHREQGLSEVSVPDRRVVVGLRRELARRRGQPSEASWETAVRRALEGLSAAERAEWELILAQHVHQWREAFESRRDGGFSTSRPLFPVAIEPVDDADDDGRAVRLRSVPS